MVPPGCSTTTVEGVLPLVFASTAIVVSVTISVWVAFHSLTWLTTWPCNTLLAAGVSCCKLSCTRLVAEAETDRSRAEPNASAAKEKALWVPRRKIPGDRVGAFIFLSSRNNDDPARENRNFTRRILNDQIAWTRGRSGADVDIEIDRWSIIRRTGEIARDWLSDSNIVIAGYDIEGSGLYPISNHEKLHILRSGVYGKDSRRSSGSNSDGLKLQCGRIKGRNVDIDIRSCSPRADRYVGRAQSRHHVKT